MKRMVGKVPAVLMSLAMAFTMIPMVGRTTYCLITDLDPVSGYTFAEDTKVGGTLTAKMAAGKTNLTISWNMIHGASGYDIFFAQCSHSEKNVACKNVETITASKILKWTTSGLKEGTPYQAYVSAYVMENGRKSYVSTSPMVHAYTGNGTKNYNNARSVSVNKTKVTLERGESFMIKGKVNKVSKKKKLMPKSHAPKLRYMTSDSKVASVSSDGMIAANGKGKCTVYVYAHNGVSKSVNVTVK